MNDETRKVDTRVVDSPKRDSPLGGAPKDEGMVVDRLAPIAIGLIAPPEAEASVWRPALREKLRKLTKKYPSTPFILLTTHPEGERFFGLSPLTKPKSPPEAGQVRAIRIAAPRRLDEHPNSRWPRASGAAKDARLRGWRIALPWRHKCKGAEEDADAPPKHPLGEGVSDEAARRTLANLFVARRCQLLFVVDDGGGEERIDGSRYALEAARRGKMPLDGRSFKKLLGTGFPASLRPREGSADPTAESLIHWLQRSEKSGAAIDDRLVLPTRLTAGAIRSAAEADLFPPPKKSGTGQLDAEEKARRTADEERRELALLELVERLDSRLHLRGHDASDAAKEAAKEAARAIAADGLDWGSKSEEEREAAIEAFATMLFEKLGAERSELIERVGKTFEHLDAYNGEVAQLFASPSGLRRLGDVLSDLTEDHGASKGVGARKQLSLHRCYKAADLLAQEGQRVTNRSLRFFVVGALAAILAFLLYSKLTRVDGDGAGSDFKYGWLSSYLAILALMGLYQVALWRGGSWWPLAPRKRPAKERYEEHRALAEGLRAQYFWRLAGVQAFASDHYLRPQRGALNWARVALETITLWNAYPLAAPGGDAADRLRLVRRKWVEDQAEYFRGKIQVPAPNGAWSTAFWKNGIKSPKWKAMLLHGLSTGLVASSVLLAIAQLWAGAIHRPHGHYPFHDGRVLACLGILLLAAAASLLLMKGSETSREAKHSPAMAWMEWLAPLATAGASLLLSGWAIHALPRWLRCHELWSLHAGDDGRMHWWSAIVAFNLGLSGLAHFYLDKRGWSEESRHYERSSIIFSSAVDALRELESALARHPDEVREARAIREMRRVVYELGKEALEENGDWVMLRRNKPLEVPHAH